MRAQSRTTMHAIAQAKASASVQTITDRTALLQPLSYLHGTRAHSDPSHHFQVRRLHAICGGDYNIPRNGKL